MKRKSQSALEFVLLISFMMFVFAGFFVAIQSKIVDTTAKNDRQYLSEVNSIILNEVALASRSLPDYSRMFRVPTHINGKAYFLNISSDGAEIMSSYDKYEQVNFLQRNVVGPIFQGENEIHKLDGIVSLGSIEYYNESFAGVFLNVNPEWCYFYENTFFSGENSCHLFEDYYLELCQNLFGLCLETNPLVPDDPELD